MQFAVFLTFVAAAMAASIPKVEQGMSLSLSLAYVLEVPPLTRSVAPGKRQASQPNVQTAAMTTADGSVVAFDAANVYLDSVAKGL